MKSAFKPGRLVAGPHLFLWVVLTGCAAAPRTCFEPIPQSDYNRAELAALLATANNAFKSHDDEASVRRAIAALAEATQLAPERPELHIKLSEAWYLLGDGFLRYNSRYGPMRKAFRAATQAGENAISAQNPAFRDALCRRKSPAELAKVLRKEDALAIYTWVAALGRLGLSENVVTVLQHDRLFQALGMVLSKLDPTLYFSAAKRFMGAYYSRAPFPGGRLAEAERLLSEAITEEPRFFGNRTLLAELVYVRTGARADFERQLRYVLNTPAEALGARLPQQAAEKRRARWLMNQVDWLFPPEGSPQKLRSTAAWFAEPSGTSDASGALEGHKISLLRNGMSVDDARFELVAGAKRSLYVSAFGWHQDNVGIALIRRVCERIKETRGKLEVKIMLENFASQELQTGAARLKPLSDLTGEPPLPRGADLLKKCGAKVLFYKPRQRGLEHALQVRHEKLFVADGERLVTGGSNIGDYYHSSSPWSGIWYDLDALVEGPIACWYHNQLQDSWRIGVAEDIGLQLSSQAEARQLKDRDQRRVNRQYGLHRMKRCDLNSAKRRPGGSRVYGVYGRPASSKKRPLLDTYLKAIAEAKHTIELYAPYFVPDERFAAALIRAARRGVRVTVMTNGTESNDESSAIFSAMLLSVIAPLGGEPPLVRSGVKIKLWPGPATLHRKGGVFDGGQPTQLAYIGSDNLDVRGQELSSESIVWTDDPLVVAQLRADFHRDVGISKPLTRRLAAEWIESERRTVFGRFRLLVARRFRKLF